MVSTPNIGMKLSKHQSQLEGNEFSLLVNGNIQSANGDVYIISNEQSNILCSKFKPGYKVIGVLPINVQNRTIFFLVNPVTNQSEIGYINNTFYEDINDEIVNCSNCNKPLKEEDFDTLKELCEYHTIVNADCLNFNINYPILSTYEIGADIDVGLPDVNNTTIFFADVLNPRRYLNINKYPRVKIAQDECAQPIYNEELDCEAIKIVPNYQSPCISLIDVSIGGSNKAGVYQFTAAYANVEKQPLTDYFTITNPISLYSTTRTITVDTDYDTGKAIKIEVNNLDEKFNYINLVVLKTTNQLTEAFLIGTFPITNTSFTYTYTGDNYQNEPRITLDELQKKRAIYEYAKGVATANKHLFWWGLKDQKEINLQPVISTLPIKWHTIEAKEGFYTNPISSNYVSFERDEVVPFGVSFKKSNGYETPTFLFVGKDKTYYQNTYNINVDEIITGLNVVDFPTCEAEILNKRWQVYNTAVKENLSTCYSNPTGDTIIQIPNTFTCNSSVFSMPSGSTEYPVQPCVTPSGNCTDPQSLDFSCCELVQVTPSGVVNLPVFLCDDLDLPDPPCDEKFGTPWYDYVPTNTSCVNASQYLMQVGNSCYLETYVCGAGEDQTVVSTPPFTIFRCGLNPIGDDCGGNTTGRNSNWFSFQAITKEQLIRTISNYGNTTIKVYEGDCTTINAAITAGTPENAYVVNLDATNNPSCKTGTNTVCLTLNNLEEGATYFVEISNDHTCGTDVTYGIICITAPEAESRYDFEEEARFRWTCTYNDGYTEYTVPVDPTCFTTPYEYGDFAYWESTARYPNNPEVWRDLCGQPIRHPKFPDCLVSHIHNKLPQTVQVGQQNRIYPLGVYVDINDIKAALNEAVTLGLITEEEKTQFTSFSIKRGNRRNNRSVIAKGLLYDVWYTPKLDGEGESFNNSTSQFYSNYPYNDLNNDVFLLESYTSQTPIKHPFYYTNYGNNRYTFHSPNTSFNKPVLGGELKIETVEWGKISGQTSEVEKHAEYVLLKNKAYNVAKSLAGLQINQEASSQAFGAGDSFGVLGTSGGAIINYIIYYAIGLATGFATNYTKYTSEWLELIKGLSTPYNPALYITSVGYYNSYSDVPNQNSVPKRRTLRNYKYLNSGNYEFTENGFPVYFNNFQRESTVYLSIQNTGVFTNFTKPSVYSAPEDNSREASCKNENLPNKNVTSYYASVKDYKPDQYGTIDQIQWLDTGYCGTIDWTQEQNNSCDVIFGGDTYINRFALKRKFPFFIQNAVNLADESPIMYKNLGNVGFPKYFFNTLQDQSSLDKFNRPFLAPPNNNLNNACVDNVLPFYYTGSAYLFNYGIPYFICESDYNVDLRHGENEGDYKDFYPHVGDIVQWTQEYKNPISFDNTYYYNVNYSKQNRENFYYTLKNSYSNTLAESKTNYQNRTIYSKQNPLNWKQYLAADYYDFPLEDGKLIALNGIEKDRVLVRQENSTKVFNAYITQQSSLETIQISVGDMFATKPQEYYKSDLGFGGSNHVALTSTPFGHFYVDSQNPCIFQLSDGLTDITRDSKTGNKIQWFVENLPFNILKDFPDVPIDNNYKYFGIALTFDNKYDRIFITKQDYKLKKEYKNKVTYINFEFYYNNSQISPIDETYFENKSWTIAYSPLYKDWISFYSFVPNYYVSTESYFQSGVNYGEAGIWSHLLTNKSYQTFYGKTYPFIMEYAIKSSPNNTILNNIRTNVEFRRYQEDLNYFVKDNVFYDKAEVYNNNQTTGKLKLIPKIKNNSYQILQNNKVVNGEIQVITENIENFWSFSSGLYNISQNNRQPLYIYKNNPYKELNPLAVSYIPKYQKDLLRNDFHVIRFENNKVKYRIEHRFSTEDTSNSNI